MSLRNLHAAYPVLYNLYGTTVWTVPLLGADHTHQGMALVQIQNSEVVFGDSLTEALRALQDVLAGSQQIVPGVTAPVISATFVVTRLQEVVANGNSVFFFWGDSKEVSSNVFTASRDTSVEVPLTMPGDEIEIRFLNTGSQTVPVREFDNRRLPIHGLEIYSISRR